MSSAAAVTTTNAIARNVTRGTRHWPHKSPVLVVSFTKYMNAYICIHTSTCTVDFMKQNSQITS